MKALDLIGIPHSSFLGDEMHERHKTLASDVHPEARGEGKPLSLDHHVDDLPNLTFCYA